MGNRVFDKMDTNRFAAGVADVQVVAFVADHLTREHDTLSLSATATAATATATRIARVASARILGRAGIPPTGVLGGAWVGGFGRMG
jgi:hypothetical protein